MRNSLIFLSILLLPLTLVSEQLSVGVVSDLENEVYAISSGKEKRLNVGMFIEKGSKIITKKDSRVKIMMMDDSLLVIAPNTEFSIDEYVVELGNKKRTSVLSLIRGRILFYINKAFSKPEGKFEVKTKNAVAGVRGTKFIVESGDKEFVGVINGEVVLKTKDIELVLTQGKFVDSSKGYVISELDQKILEEYTNTFHIRKGRMQLAMLERGTGISGESLLEHDVRNKTLDRKVSTEVIEGKTQERSGDLPSDAIEKRDSGDEMVDGIIITKKDGGDYDIKSGNRMIVIRILLPFVKLRR
ncbi:MAG: FecR family protein [Deltaproteobacteria bacterium]|nr:FecR family protein [Deltaproteobacteria bacterium]